MRFVTENNVECRRSVVLCVFHDTERVVGAKDHRHRVQTRSPERLGDRLRVRGDRDFKLLKRGVFVVSSGACIGADPDIAMRDRPLRRPFPHRLLEQRYRRHQIEHPPPDTRNGFRYAQRCKGLARTARHDQLAAIVIFESAGHVVERGLLMGAQAERLVPKGKVFRFIVDEVGPVERPTSEIAEAKHGACGLQWSNGLDRVRPPSVAGIDHDTGCEGVTGRCGDERIEMKLRNLGARRVALALNGTVTALTLLGDQVDTGIGAIESLLQVRPFGPQPDFGEPFLVEGILDEVRLHQPLEEAPLFSFGIGDGPYVVQRSLETVSQFSSSRCITGLWPPRRSFASQAERAEVRLESPARSEARPVLFPGKITRLGRAGTPCAIVLVYHTEEHSGASTALSISSAL